MGERRCLCLQFPDELTGLLGHPSLRRMSRNARNVYTPRSNFDEKENKEGLKSNGFDGEEITRQQSILVVIEEPSPSRGRFLLGNGQYIVTPKNLAYLFVADAVAKLLEFAGDAVIAPMILAGELEHKLDDLRFDRWSSPFLG